MWENIYNDIQNEQISSAAQKLRHGSEDFFRSVSGSLEVPVVFKEDYQWELGQLQFPAMNRLRDLLKILNNQQSLGEERI